MAAQRTIRVCLSTLSLRRRRNCSFYSGGYVNKKGGGNIEIEVDRIRVAGLITTVFAALIFSTLIVEHEFPVFKYAEPPAEPPVDLSQFLWNYRVIDLIAQAFVLFAAAACCMALLKTEEREK